MGSGFRRNDSWALDMGRFSTERSLALKTDSGFRPNDALALNDRAFAETTAWALNA
jgi:hypothetical protein